VVQDGDNGGKDLAEVTVKTTVANETRAAATCRVEAILTGPDGRRVGSVATETAIPAGATAEVSGKSSVRRPQLWSIEKPNLYTLKVSILHGGRVVDTQTVPFGIRTIRFDADKGFFLNGEHVKLKGTCNHQDLVGVGIALPDRMHVWRIQKLKEMGSNAYRCSHNPPAQELLDACDRLGMVVMDENRHLGSSPEILGQVESMVTRDRNHPSIIMWSMCNEEGAQGTDRGKQMFSAMMDVVRRHDTTRPITCAMNGGWGSGITGVEDLQGFNYNPGQYDPFHKAFPKMPVYASETASHVSDRGMYENSRERGYVSEYGGNPEPSWKPVAERDFVAGSFVWTGFDYRGEPSPYDWPCIASHFGIMDLCGFPKDSWWYYKAWWGDKPLVHILPHWNWAGKTGQEISVWCYGNTQRVELLLNGVSVGIKDMPRYGHVEWRVKYAPGVLEARGLTDGKVVATDKRETTRDPVRIQLQPVNTQIAADNEDVAIIPVAILDARGRVVPTADNEVSFRITGPGRIAGVGNGDSSSHEPDKARSRRAFNGYCMVIVQATQKAGEIKLTATSPGLKEASVVVTAR
jgi:beta-galactosidase